MFFFFSITAEFVFSTWQKQHRCLEGKCSKHLARDDDLSSQAEEEGCSKPISCSASGTSGGNFESHHQEIDLPVCGTPVIEKLFKFA